MDGKKNGLHGAFVPQGGQPQFHHGISGLPISLPLLLGTALLMAGWLPSAGLAWWQLFAFMLAVSAVFWLLQLTKAGKWTFSAGMAIAALVGILAHSRVSAGFGCLGNDVLQRLTLVNGKIYLDFAAADAGAVLWAVLPLVAVLTLLLNKSVQSGKLLPALPLLAAVYGMVISGLYPMDAGAALLGLGAVLLVMRRIEPRGWLGKPVWLAVVLVCTLAAAGGAMAMAQEPKNGSEVLREAIHDAVYHQDTNSMPEGNLRNLRGWKKTDTPALEITMTQPQKLYLRGRVYETYTGTAWEAADPEILAQQEDLFYWLHRSGLYGQSQIGTATALTGEVQPQTLTVRNLSACGETGYYPYALLGSGTLEEDRIGDARFPAADSLTYLPGSVPEWYEVQQTLAQMQSRESVAEYLAAEEAYEAYVTEADVQLTNESWSVLKRQLGDGVSSGTLSQIRQFIRDYLEENLEYQETESTPNGGGDFLQFTLEKAGYGYSVHYATAAALMLRYFGVPARYVEGYFLSAEEADRYAAGETIVLTEEHAHAWAEYYLPGVGFIPFEVTPGYMDDEELELGGALAQSDHTYSGNHLKYAQVEQPERIEEPKQDRFSFTFRPIYLVWGGLAGLLILLVLILKKRKRLKTALESIQNAPNREAIAMGYGYALKLLRCCQGFTPEGREEAAQLNREALFSNHDMTDGQRQQMEAFSQTVLQGCREHWTWRQKLRYRLWECLY